MWKKSACFCYSVLCVFLLTACSDDPQQRSGDAAPPKDGAKGGDGKKIDGKGTSSDGKTTDGSTSTTDGPGPIPIITWTVATTPTNDWLYGVWGTGPGDVWAVGWGSVEKGPMIFHYNGTAWQQDTSVPVGVTHVLRAVWGTSATNVWAVGNDGAIMHYTGSGWAEVESNTDKHLYGLWGSSENDIWAAGSDGIILHFNGTAWASMASNVSGIFAGVWSSSSSDVWAVGDSDPSILHYGGSSWSPSNYTEAASMTSAWGTGPNNVWAVGWASRFVMFNGTSWIPIDTGLTEATGLLGIWGFSAKDIWITGEVGVLQYNGVKCTQMELPAGIKPRDIWGTSAKDLWIVGESVNDSSVNIVHGH